ncbi:MAG: 3-oxoacyl-[Paludibacteraceae bacterium]|nr:3-oxoacyl-[acyl-carrier-protein] reductase [Paludibacteraceae bacterium]
MLLTDKVALITGAARGIGKAIALRFAAEGCDIAFTDIVTTDSARDLISSVEALGRKAVMYESNATSFEDAHDVVSRVKQTFGRIDILVNNAGITRDTLILRMNEEQWDSVINVNLKSAFNYTHACAPVMLSQRSGSIISLASVVGEGGNAGQANYAASKAGIIGFTKSVAKELGSRGVRANCIAPGFILTDMTRQLPEEKLQEFVKMIPLRRGGTPEDVANVALFLASDMSSYVTAQVINCCGGMA